MTLSPNPPRPDIGNERWRNAEAGRYFLSGTFGIPNGFGSRAAFCRSHRIGVASRKSSRLRPAPVTVAPGEYFRSQPRRVIISFRHATVPNTIVPIILRGRPPQIVRSVVGGVAVKVRDLKIPDSGSMKGRTDQLVHVADDVLPVHEEIDTGIAGAAFYRLRQHLQSPAPTIRHGTADPSQIGNLVVSRCCDYAPLLHEKVLRHNASNRNRGKA